MKQVRISSQELLPLCHSSIENKSMFLSYSQACGIFQTFKAAGHSEISGGNLFMFKLIYQKEGQLNTTYQPFVFYTSFHNCTIEMCLKNDFTHWMFPGRRITEHRKSCTNVESYKVLNLHMNQRTLFFCLYIICKYFCIFNCI